VGLLQALCLLALYLAGREFQLGEAYLLSLLAVAGLFGYQQLLIRQREPEACFRAFLNNKWVGAVIFAGIAAHYAA
jgi:4-hydroxybenzoate polyprenyltransferase